MAKKKTPVLVKPEVVKKAAPVKPAAKKAAPVKPAAKKAAVPELKIAAIDLPIKDRHTNLRQQVVNWKNISAKAEGVEADNLRRVTSELEHLVNSMTNETVIESEFCRLEAEAERLLILCKQLNS